MAAEENARLAREVYESFNRHNFDSVLAQTTEDVEVVQVAFGQTDRGREGFREFMALWKTMAPDGEVEVAAQLPGEEGVTNENVRRGTHTGPLATPTGVLPATRPGIRGAVRGGVAR